MENGGLEDVILIDENGEEKIIVERKSLADLASSIRDGRYAEQSFRLNQCSMHNHTIYYAIEGDLRTYKPFNGKVDKRTLLSAMVSISYFKGFSVHRTLNIDETAEWIVNFALKLNKEGLNSKPFYGTVATNPKEVEIESATVPITVPITTNYSDVCNSNRVKKNNITPENIGIIMLSQIPGVSSAAANVIMTKFVSIKELINTLSSDKKALDGISIVTKTGDNRKISKTCISNIYNYLLPSIDNA